MEHKKKILTQSLEEYLETIFIISKKKKIVRVKDLVNRLNVKSASVIGALKKLTKNNYVNHEHYGYIELTSKGLKRAAKIYEKHKILYKFLTDVLNVSEEIAEKDACMIEHHISNETLKKIIKFVESIEPIKI